MKTTIQHFRHESIQKSLNKNVKGDSLPDIAKLGEGKKVKVEEAGVVAIKAGKGDFSDYSFKEGNTNVVKMQEIFTQEKGKEALKKLEASEHPGAAPKVKGGAKGKKKAASKAAKKGAKKGASVSAESKTVEKVLKYTPSKSAGKKETPQKAGKVSAKASVGKKATPAMPSPGGKKSTKTTD